MRRSQRGTDAGCTAAGAITVRDEKSTEAEEGAEKRRRRLLFVISLQAAAQFAKESLYFRGEGGTGAGLLR